jgi:hypothetical protein
MKDFKNSQKCEIFTTFFFPLLFLWQGERGWGGSFELGPIAVFRLEKQKTKLIGKV